MKRRKSSRRRSSARRSHRRRRSNPRRGGLFMLAAPRRRSRRNVSHRRSRRRRNPSLSRIFGGRQGSGGIVPLIVGGGVGFLAARMIPQNFLAQYNKGWTGYALNIAAGAGTGWLLGQVWDRQAAMGAYVGTGVAVLSRIVVEQFNIGGGGGVSGDLDFDLGYYTSDRFPYPQGPGGPFDNFPGTPYLANAPFGATSAAAVRAGQAAAAALPAAAPGAMAGFPSGSNTSGRWADSRWT